MQHLIQKQKITLYILLAFVCVLGGIVYIEIASIGRMKTQIVALKTTAATLASTDGVTAGTSAKVANLAARTKILGGMVLTKDAIPQFLSHLEDLATSGGVTLDVTNAETNTRNGVGVLSISFSVKGTQAGVQQFLDILQHQPQIIRFTQLNVTIGVGATTNANVILEIVSFTS